MTAKEVQNELRSRSSPKRRKANEYFFKTGKGEYGYRDIFIGVSLPDSREVAKQFTNLEFNEIKKLLRSKIHEDRSTALLILVNKFKSVANSQEKQVFDFYLDNYNHVNNWDLVDISSYQIVGEYIRKYPEHKKILNSYAISNNLWKRRLSIVATWALIREGEYKWTMKNARVLLSDPHDLTHKAVGWMLREVWKRNPSLVEAFLIKNYKQVPRTTLRYTIERMGERKRKQFLKGPKI